MNGRDLINGWGLVNGRRSRKFTEPRGWAGPHGWEGSRGRLGLGEGLQARVAEDGAQTWSSVGSMPLGGLVEEQGGNTTVEEVFARGRGAGDRKGSHELHEQ